MSKKTIQLIFFTVFTGIILVLLFFILKPYLGVIFVSGVFAVTFYPLYEKLVAKFKNRRNLAAFATTFLILIFVIIPIIIMSVLLLKEAVNLYNSITIGNGSQGLISQANILVDKISSIFPSGVIDSQINLDVYARDVLNWVIGHFGSVFAAVFGGIFNFILMLISLYYFFIFGSRIKRGLIAWSPLPDEHDKEFIQTLRSSIDAVLRGRIIVFIIHAIFIGSGFVIFGIGSPILWGFVGGMASLVPILGTSIVTAPAIIFLLLSHKIGACIGLFIWSILVVGFGDNFVSAILLKNKIQVHPLVILFSILGGVEVFGAIGFLVGPVVISAFIALMKIYPFIMSHQDQQA